MTLNLATKANQATTLPSLLIVHYAQESNPNTSIDVKFEEVETLKSDDKASVKFVVGSGVSTYGGEPSIEALTDTYTFLQGKHQELVCFSDSTGKLPTHVHPRSKNGLVGLHHSIPQSSSLWKDHCMN